MENKRFYLEIVKHNCRYGLPWLPFSMLGYLSVCQLLESFDLEKFKHINVRCNQVSGLHNSSTVFLSKPLLKSLPEQLVRGKDEEEKE